VEKGPIKAGDVKSFNFVCVIWIIIADILSSWIVGWIERTLYSCPMDVKEFQLDKEERDEKML
jgi:hypothetical protein